MKRAASRFNNELRYRSGDDARQVFITPEYVVHPLRTLLGCLALDPCTTVDNPLKARKFYALPNKDGLVLPWTVKSGFIFVNPPYSKAREPWVRRCVDAKAAGAKVVLLIPAATDTRIFQTAMQHSNSVLFLKGRLKFGVLRPNRRQVAASHGSALLGFNVDLQPLSKLGMVMHQKGN